MLNIRKTKSSARCRGDYNCKFYENHVDYKKLLKQYRNIPVGEYVLFVNDDYCVCPKHAVEVMNQTKTELLLAMDKAFELGWAV